MPCQVFTFYSKHSWNIIFLIFYTFYPTWGSELLSSFYILCINIRVIYLFLFSHILGTLREATPASFPWYFSTSTALRCCRSITSLHWIPPCYPTPVGYHTKETRVLSITLESEEEEDEENWTASFNQLHMICSIMGKIFSFWCWGSNIETDGRVEKENGIGRCVRMLVRWCQVARRKPFSYWVYVEWGGGGWLGSCREEIVVGMFLCAYLCIFCRKNFNSEGFNNYDS